MAENIVIGNINSDTKPKSTEITSSDSPYYEQSQFRPYNPDKLYRKKGNYDIYDDMREDDAVKSILMTKKYLMLGNGWTIDLKDEEDEQQIEIKEFIEKALNEDIDIDFNKSMLEMLTCMDYGVSFSEIVWELKDAQYKIKYVKTRAPHPFKIYTDKKGNIEKLTQNQELTGDIDIPKLDNIIVMPFQMEFDNWYGKSDLKSAYRAWWSKDFIIKAWNIYLDRFGMPLAVGKFDTTASETDQKKVQHILNRLQTKSSITLPKEFELEFLEATRGGEAGYEAALNNYNVQIARSMLMPDLLGMAGDKTSGGSFALGQTQYDMFLKTLEWTRHELQRKIQRKIVDNLVKYNFAVEDIPQFKFKAMSETVKIESLKTWIDLQKAGKYKPSAEEINWARRILGAPEGEVEDNAPIPIPGMPGQEVDEDGKPIEGEVDEDGKPIEGKQDGTGQPGKPKDGKPLDGSEPNDKKGNANPEEDIDVPEDKDEKKMAKGDMRAPVMAETKNDFAKVSMDQTNTIDAYARQVSGTIATMQESLLQTVKKGRYIENKKLDKVSVLELKFTDRLRLDIKAGMREMFKLGKRDANIELNKTKNFSVFREYAETDHISQYFRVEQMPSSEFKEGTIMMTDIDMNKGAYCSWGMLQDGTKAVQAYLFFKNGFGWTPKSVDAYVNEIKGIKQGIPVNKEFITDDDLQQIVDKLTPWNKYTKDYALDEEDAFDMVVNNAPLLAMQSINDDILKKVKLTLSNGIASGLSQSEIIGQLKEVFEPYITAYDGYKLDTVIRTNYATAYNQSKMAYFEPAKQDGTIYGYQYSAIMDSRTSEVCASLDGRIFKADNVGDIEPPLHFNCRSTLIPILKDEIENKQIFGADDKENAKFFPDDGKFKESTKDLSAFEMKPGGFYVKKKG